MSITDYITIVVYFAGLAIASFCFRGQGSLRDYFLGGGNVPWWAAMFSGIATIVSAVSYLGGPGVAFHGDFTIHQYRLGLPFAIAILCLVMLPLFFNKQRYSIYSYLEERFDLKTRLLASGLFIVLKVCYLGLAIYAPTLLVRQMFDAPTWQVILLVGGVTTIYTVVGGIKAVIWTDTVQLLILLIGLVVVGVVAVARIDGGFENPSRPNPLKIQFPTSRRPRIEFWP
jgi:Na+/proline symporter